MSAHITNGGLAIKTNRMLGAGTEPKYIGIGTGVTDAAHGDTALQTEASETSTTKATGTGTRITTNQTNDTNQWTATINIGGTKTISEAGLFDAASAGVLYARAVFTGVPLVAGDQIAPIFKDVNSCGT